MTATVTATAATAAAAAVGQKEKFLSPNNLHRPLFSTKTIEVV